MINPLISVIIPVYNVEDYLNECVESILKQSYNHLEVLLINDGSTDESRAICDNLSIFDKRIKTIHKNNEGVSSARNLGLRLAKGDYVIFVDADDSIEPNFCEHALKNIQDNNSNLCVMINYFVNQTVFSHAKLKSKCLSSEEAIELLLKMKFPTSLWAGIYDRNILSDIYLNEDIHYWEDFEYQFRVLLNASIISISNFPGYHYRKREGSANNQSFNDKILTCLLIPQLVVKKVESRYPKLTKHAKKLSVLFLINVIGYLSKSNTVDEKYYLAITKESRLVLLRSIFIPSVSMISKLYIALCSINSNIFHNLYKMFKRAV